MELSQQNPLVLLVHDKSKINKKYYGLLAIRELREIMQGSKERAQVA
jgi:hypothetical protein